MKFRWSQGMSGVLEEWRCPSPSNEPWIGVIDTPFNEDVYFSDWVSAETTLPSEVFAPTRLPAWDLCVVDYCGRAVS